MAERKRQCFKYSYQQLEKPWQIWHFLDEQVCFAFFGCGNEGDTWSQYYVWRHGGSSREQQINLPCWRLQSQGHSVSGIRLQMPLPGQTACMPSSILCTLTPTVCTQHCFPYNCTGKHSSRPAHSVPPIRCLCQAWGLACLPERFHPTQNMDSVQPYPCIYHPAKLLSFLITLPNLLFHWNSTDP